ncbi:zona pellucida sperm-binding protein 3-like [Neosynchiropus ocellatus]
MDLSLRKPLWTVISLACALLVSGQSQASDEIDGGPRARGSALKHPLQKTRRVTVTCHPNSLEVVIQADMFDNGLLVRGKHLRLGSGSAEEAGPCGAAASGPRQFSITAPLTQCGTKLSSTQDKIVYSNVLIYSPEPSNDGLFRLDATAIPVECHYDRMYAVNSVPLLPSWVPFVAEMSAQDQIHFNLQLLTDDGLFVRGSNSYFLGDPIHIEASIIMDHHMPLKIYVDHCVATATPDAEAELRYDFINHHGCLVDAYLSDSKSRFFPGVDHHSLQFSVDAFRFHQEPNNQVFITCRLKALPLASPATSENRACSFIGDSWESVDGDDQACASCDFRHGSGGPPATSPPIEMTTAEPAAEQEPAHAQSSSQHHSATFHRIRPKAQLRQNPLQSQAWIKRETERAVQLGPLIVLPYPNSTAVTMNSGRRCGREFCREDEICCAEGNHSLTLTCCRQYADSTYVNIAVVTRKLSGVLIMLLLFAVGYLVQRILCSKSRRTTPEDHPTATVSQEPLVQRDTTVVGLMDRDPGPQAVLPSYEECKHLPTYEETMRGDGRRPSMDCVATRPGHLAGGAEPTQTH